jgi:exonuclease SbcC
MVKISSIFLKNIKGQNTAQELTGKDIILGSNGIGKTTRLQALGIALLGYVPGKGKKSDETFKLSSSDTMEVGLGTSDFNFTREFKKKVSKSKDGSTKVSIQQILNVSPSKGESKINEKESRILSELGSFPVMLDFNEFLSLSDSKRREFIYNLAGFKSEDWTKEKAKEYLEGQLLTTELEVNNPEQYEIMKSLINGVLNEYPEKYDISMGLQSMIDWTKTKLSYWNDEKKRSAAAVQKIGELKNKLSETDRNLKANKKQLEELQSKLITSEKQISEDTQKKKNIDIRLEKIEQLKKIIAEEELKKCSVNTNEIESKIKNLKANIKQVDNKDKIKAIDDEIIKIQDEDEPIIKDKDDVKTKGIELAAQIKANQETLDRVKNVKDCCVLDKRIACNKDFGKFIEYTEGKINTLTVQRQILADTFKELNDKDNALNEKYKKLEVNKKALTNEEIEANRTNNSITADINTLEKSLNEAKSFDTLKVEKIARLNEELSKLQNEPIEAIAPIDILIKQRDSISVNINSLKEKIEEQEKAKTTLSNLKSSMIDSKTAEYNYISFKSIDDALGAKGLQGKLMKETLEPIQNDIQANLRAMGIDHEFYFSTESEGGKEIFQFGWKNDFGDKRNFDALSTGQQLMLLIAILITFIEKSNPKCRILAIDNIENLDSKNFPKVIDGLNKISDKLDNIILSGVIDVTEVDGFKVWNLDKAGAENEQSA